MVDRAQTGPGPDAPASRLALPATFALVALLLVILRGLIALVLIEPPAGGWRETEVDRR